MQPNFTALPWVTSYGLILLIGLALWWWLARSQAKSRELDCSHIDLLAPLIIFWGALGAKVFGIISPNDIQISGDQYIVAGRLRLFGWILMGIVVLAIYCRVHGISFLKTAYLRLRIYVNPPHLLNLAAIHFQGFLQLGGL